MAHISTAWLYSGLISALVLSQAVQSRPTTQSDINNIAEHLKLTVWVETNHLSTGNYDIAFHLLNGGNSRILDTDNWEIIFSLHNRDLFTRGEFQVHGFVIMPFKESLYKMFPAPGGVFPGLNSGQAFKITVNCQGLSVFKQDIHPRYIIRADNTQPKTIKSTDFDDLRFVKLSGSSNSGEDLSRMSSVQRTVMTPDVIDMERVPPTITVPTTKNITIQPRMPLLNLSSTPVFYIWADQSVSPVFREYFYGEFKKIAETTVLTFVNSAPAADADKIYIQQTGPDPGKSKDYYKLAVRPKVAGVRNFNLIHMSATSEEGLHNAVESLKGAAGLYEILPDLTIEDDARFSHRSLSLDLTKNFIPLSTLKKVLRLMSMYKLNKLELILGSDYGWRIDIPDMETLSAMASKRCQDQDCLPPYYGSGAFPSEPGSGSISLPQFADLIKTAASMHIDVIPRINFLGGLLSAKRASHEYYEMYRNSNLTKAERYHLNSPLPNVDAQRLPEDAISIEGLLDPCRIQTNYFIKRVIYRINSAYKQANVTLKAFHAGGDELTQFLGEFPSCALDVAITSTGSALQHLINLIQGELEPLGAMLHLNEEAIFDPATGDCLNLPPQNKKSIVAHFYKTFPGSPDEWNLTPEQLAYMDGEVAVPDPTNPNATPDPLVPYTGQTKGLTSWILPYRCANRGYNIVLKPENFFALDQAYELDFDEPGNRKLKRFHIINMHRMMMYEPLNHYINMDLGKDGYTFLQYRMCRLFPCETLTKPENVIGLTATLDTSVIRTEAMLWHMLLPRLLCFAEKAWRQGDHENILKAEEPITLVNPENLERRSAAITMEINRLMNNLAYKEGGRLDEEGFTYRVPTLGASIHLGLVLNRLPPYPLMFKADTPALEIQIRDLNAANPEWKPLFEFDPSTGMMRGGKTFTFPQSNDRVELRALSAGGKNETLTPPRPGRSVLVTGDIDNYLPREIPVDLRQGTCLPIEENMEDPSSRIDIRNLTNIQWQRVLQNIAPVVRDQQTFMSTRQRALEEVVNRFNSGGGMASLPAVFQGIQEALATGQNISQLGANNILRAVYERDIQLYEGRSNTMEARYRSWQQEYLRCRAGQAQPTLLPSGGSPGSPAGGPAGSVAGGFPGAQAGGAGGFPGAQAGGAGAQFRRGQSMGPGAGQRGRRS